jgi:hypothetical protein
LFDRLPIPSPDQQFRGDAYLLGYDALSKELFARRFFNGVPNDLAELPLVWEHGMEVFRVSLEYLILMLANSLLGDDCVHLPRLIGSECCLVEGYLECLGMELFIVIRFGQWVLDFAELLFQEEEDEYMDMLATLGRALDQWRLVLKRGNSDAWRAYENGLGRMTYSQKLIANNEQITNLYTLTNKCCFGRGFLAGSPPRPVRGLDKDKAWLGNFGRQQRSTEEGVERAAQRLGELFERRRTPPPTGNTFAMLFTGLLEHSRSSTEASSLNEYLETNERLQNEGLPATTATCMALPLPPLRRPFLSLSTVAPEYRDSLAGQEPAGPFLGMPDASRERAASLLNTLTKHSLCPSSEPRQLVRLQPRRKSLGGIEGTLDVDPLQDSSFEQTEEASLLGLVSDLWKVVASKPETNNTVTRRKVRDLMKEVKGGAAVIDWADPWEDDDVESKAGIHAQCGTTTQMGGKQSKEPQPSSTWRFNFLPNWF